MCRLVGAGHGHTACEACLLHIYDTKYGLQKEEVRLSSKSFFVHFTETPDLSLTRSSKMTSREVVFKYTYLDAIHEVATFEYRHTLPEGPDPLNPATGVERAYDCTALLKEFRRRAPLDLSGRCVRDHKPAVMPTYPTSCDSTLTPIPPPEFRAWIVSVCGVECERIAFGKLLEVMDAMPPEGNVVDAFRDCVRGLEISET